MSTGNYSVNVPKLKGRENYDDWAFAVENFLILEGVDLSTKNALDEQSDKKARAKMILTIDPSLYVHIKNEQTVRSVWIKLKSLFDDSGFTRKISLLRNLISIRLETCESMTSYVTQLVDTAQKLKGTGFEINDEWVGSLLLAGLPEKFSPMIMAIEHSGMMISADAIKTKLLDMSADVEVKSEGAFIVRNSHQNRGRVQSTNYGGSGASGTNGRSPYHSYQSPVNTNVRSTVSPKTIHCYKCKQIGHFKNQCTAEKDQTNTFSAVFLANEFKKSDFYVDSGASTHLVSDENMLKNVSYQPKTTEIIVANQTSVQVLCCGNLQLTTRVGTTQHNIDVNNVLCVPNLTTNLLSVSRMISCGNTVVFSEHGCRIYNSQNDCIGEANLENGVYKLNIVKSDQLLAAAVQTSCTLWHRRMGHINANDLQKMKNGAVEGLTYQEKADLNKSSCTVCCEGKQSRLPFPQSSTKSKDLLELVHTDVCGPMENLSLGMAKYYLLFVDDFSRMCFVFFLKSKHETFKHFKDFKQLVENQTNRKIKILRSDNGGEFCSAEMENYLKCCGIIHQKTNSYTPEQNGLCERYNRSIVEKARCLLFDADFDKQLWAEAVNTAVYLKNRSPAAGLDQNVTPVEVWTGRKPNVSDIRVFGSPVMVHVPKEKRRKWDKKAMKMYLVGYSENIKGYRVYDPETQNVTVARDVVVMENDSSTISIMVEKNHEQEIEEEKSEKDQALSKETNAEQDENDGTYVVNESSSGSEDSFAEALTTDDMQAISEQQDTTNLLGKRMRRRPDYYGVANMCVEEQVPGEEISLQEAMDGPEKDQWQQAMKEELKSFNDNDTWELVDRPKNGTVVKNKWVFKKKFNSEGEERYRARLVAKGFTQKKGIDFNETFSPVLRYSTLRLLFALSVNLNLNMNHLDVPTAFLNGFLTESVYMEIPDNSDFVDCKNKVLKLKRAIYGLKQSARAWYTRVEECLLKLEYQKSKYEPCLFIKCNNNVKVYIALFVDDFFIFYNCQNTYEHLKRELVMKFKIKDLGQIKQCLGMHVNVMKDCITVDQKQFVNSILKRFNMTDCSVVETPMEVNLKLEKEISNDCLSKYPYQQLIGSLMYLSVLTRPDISYSVSFLSQYNNCYNENHWKHLKRLLKYLQKTKSYGLVYKKDGHSLHGFVDSDWASCSLDRRSYTGFCFIMSGCVISFESKKQKTVALSSTEAEYMALSEACKEAIYLKNVIFEILKLNKSMSICLYSDNQSSMKLAVNPLFHKRTKHIDVRHHFVRDCVAKTDVKIEYISTSDMPADIFTKSLNSSKHYKFLNLLGISEIA